MSGKITREIIRAALAAEHSRAAAEEAVRHCFSIMKSVAALDAKLLKLAAEHIATMKALGEVLGILDVYVKGDTDAVEKTDPKA